MNPIRELFLEIEKHKQMTAHASLIMEAKKEYASLLRKTNYAFALYMRVKIVDGCPVIENEKEDLETLSIVTDFHWFDDSYEPEYDNHLLWVTESEEFKNIKEPGFYYFFQSGNVEPEISRDWETGIADLDGWIFEGRYTVCENLDK